MTLRAISGIREIADDFDGFILDLWGLIHDGEKPYPPAAETLRALRDAGKRTLLLSNAPRRAHALIEAMTLFGLSVIMRQQQAVKDRAPAAPQKRRKGRPSLKIV